MIQNNHFYAGYKIQVFASMVDRIYEEPFFTSMLIQVNTPRTYTAQAWRNGMGENRFMCTASMPSRERALELIYLMIDELDHRWHELDT